MARRLVVPVCAPHPGHDLVQEQRDHEHPFGIAEMRDGDDRDARLAGRAVQQRRGVERLPLQPLLESGRGHQRVDLHGQREAVLGGIERLEIDDADALERRVLDELNQRRQIEVLPVVPGAGEQRGQERVLAAARIGVGAGQRQDAGGRDACALGQRLAVVADGRGRARRTS